MTALGVEDNIRRKYMMICYFSLLEWRVDGKMAVLLCLTDYLCQKKCYTRQKVRRILFVDGCDLCRGLRGCRKISGLKTRLAKAIVQYLRPKQVQYHHVAVEM